MRRVQMELSDQSFDRLKRLKELNEGSYSDVMKDALRLYEYILDLESEGAEFMIKRDGIISNLKLFI